MNYRIREEKFPDGTFVFNVQKKHWLFDWWRTVASKPSREKADAFIYENVKHHIYGN